MLKVAIIEEDRSNRKKIANHFAIRNNIELLAVVENMQEFINVLTLKSPLVPDMVLFSTLMGAAMRDETSVRVQKICPGCSIINYNIVNNGETLIISASKGSLPIGGHSFAFDALELLVELSQKNGSDGMQRDQEAAAIRGQGLLEKKITLREMEVVSGLSIGLTYDEISTKMSVSINTVRRYVKNIYTKLGVKNKVQLINRVTYRNTHAANFLSSNVQSTDIKMA